MADTFLWLQGMFKICEGNNVLFTTTLNSQNVINYLKDILRGCPGGMKLVGYVHRSLEALANIRRQPLKNYTTPTTSKRET